MKLKGRSGEKDKEIECTESGVWTSWKRDGAVDKQHFSNRLNTVMFGNATSVMKSTMQVVTHLSQKYE